MMKHCTYRLLFFWTLLVFSQQLTYGQTTFVADSNFRNTLVARYPSIMNASKEIINAQAQALSGTLNISHSNIYSIGYEMQLFTSISGLECSANYISDLTYLSFLPTSNIKVLNLGYNQLTQIPQNVMNAFPNLEVLSVTNNPLTHLPEFTNNTLLQALSADVCSLTSLPASLSYLPNLNYLNLDQNQLTSLPSLAADTSLEQLIVSNNNLTALPDLSQNKKLYNIDCAYNQLTAAPNVATMDSLVTYKISHNKLTVIPHFGSIQPYMALFDCSYNLITEIPNLTSLPDSCNVDYTYNLVSMQYIAIQTSLPGFGSLRKFAPQKTIDISRTYNVKQHRSYTFILPMDDIQGTVCTWYKNGSFLQTISGVALQLPTIQLGDGGVYTVAITNNYNPALNGIIINVNFDTLVVQPCFKVYSSPVYSVTAGTCDLAGKVTISPHAIGLGTEPYTFKLKNTTNNALSSLTSDSTFSGLRGTEYTLVMSDSLGCTEEYQMPNIVVVTYPLGIPADMPETIAIAQEVNCDKNNVFTPDGDGVNDTFFIEKPGAVKIYNSNGVLVKELVAPATWDGSDKSGNIVPGYYIIQYKDGYVPVTIVY